MFQAHTCLVEVSAGKLHLQSRYLRHNSILLGIASTRLLVLPCHKRILYIFIQCERFDTDAQVSCWHIFFKTSYIPGGQMCGRFMP